MKLFHEWCSGMRRDVAVDGEVLTAGLPSQFCDGDPVDGDRQKRCKECIAAQAVVDEEVESPGSKRRRGADVCGIHYIHMHTYTHAHASEKHKRINCCACCVLQGAICQPTQRRRRRWPQRCSRTTRLRQFQHFWYVFPCMSTVHFICHVVPMVQELADEVEAAVAEVLCVCKVPTTAYFTLCIHWQAGERPRMPPRSRANSMTGRAA